MNKLPAAENTSLASRLLVAWQQALFLRLVPSNRATHFVAYLFYLQLQQYLKPALSLEVGAHQADFSQKMRVMFPDMQVVAFEACPSVYRHFKSSESFREQNIAYLNLAVSDSKEQVAFNALAEFGGLSGRNSLMEATAPGESRKVMVPSISGDAFLEDFETDNIALWIDVEGAAGKVLPGFSDSLAAGRFSSIFIEVERRELWQGQWLDSQVMDFLQSYGYLPVLCDAEHCPPSHSAEQYNLVFMRAADLKENMVDLLVQTYLNTVDSVEIAQSSTAVPKVG